MKIIVEDGSPSACAGTMETSWWVLLRWHLQVRWISFRRRFIPHLVWYGAEIDVVVTLMQDKLPPFSGATPDVVANAAYHVLTNGAFAEIERTFREMGITFDKGMGFDGRDWEWDYSLKGPISVRFKRRARYPERRRERPRPKLVVTSPRPHEL